jgi:hypothetical protein
MKRAARSELVNWLTGEVEGARTTGEINGATFFFFFRDSAYFFGMDILYQSTRSNDRELLGGYLDAKFQ